MLVFGTLILSWHARFMRVAREVLWRSSMVRRLAALLTGLTFECPMRPMPSFSPAASDPENLAKTATKRRESELTKALRQQSHHHGHKHGVDGGAGGPGKDAGVKFTFIIFENQRRWVGLGWTTSLFAYERSAWTDEHNNSVPSRDSFELPETDEGSLMHWRWVRGSKWKVDGVPDEGKEAVDYDGDEGKNGWVYYDNKWQNGRRGQDGWGRWTRRRKWYRDAELVEVGDEEQGDLPSEPAKVTTSSSPPTTPPATTTTTPPTTTTTTAPAKPPKIQAYSTTGEMMVSPMASEFGKASSSSFTSTAATLTPVQETDGAADAESDATATANGEAHHANGISIAHGGNAKRGGEDGKETSDTSSLHSTSSSSRSFFRPGSLRRKITDRSSTSAVSSTTVTSSSSAPPAPGAHSAGRDGRTQQRARRPSEARSETRGEEEVSGLGTAVDIAIHDEGKGSWGIGDEARMSLE